jgi:transposase
MISMEDWVTIRNLKRHNPDLGTRAIAKLLCVSRNTVKKALKDTDAPCNTRKPYVNKELKKFEVYIKIQYSVKHLKGSRVLNDLRDKGCLVSRSAFYRYLKRFSNKSTQAYMRYETAPGEQAQFDWSPYSVIINGVLTKVQVFGLILGYSRYRVYSASLSQSQSSVLEAMENGLNRIGGVPRRIQTDNHKTLVINASSDNFQWNPRYLKLAEHYGFNPSRSAVRHPWSKGKVENPFWYVENHFILDSEFSSFDDFCSRLEKFEYKVNHRVHDTTRTEPQTLFDNVEKDILIPLPRNRFVGTCEQFRKVSSDCLISYKGNRYSVPHVFACKEVWVRESQGRYIMILPQSNRDVASHVLVTGEKGRVIMKHEHFVGYRGTRGTWSSLCDQFLRICPDHEDFLERLRVQKRISPSRHLTKIVEAIKHFRPESIEAVIDMCHRYNLYNGSFFLEMLHEHGSQLSVSPLDLDRDLFDNNGRDLHGPPDLVRSLDSYCTEDLVR